MSEWKTLDTKALLTKRKVEQTTSGNAGGFAVPLGAPLRRAIPVGSPQYKPVVTEPKKKDPKPSK